MEGVRELIRYGNISVGDTLGYTALHWMAVRGNEKLADLLIRSGANVDAMDNSQQTPLQRATAHGIVLAGNRSTIHKFNFSFGDSSLCRLQMKIKWSIYLSEAVPM